MTRFNKVSTLLKQLSDAHDMTKATERTGAAAVTVEVQAKDEAGFWCIVGRFDTRAKADAFAASLGRETRVREVGR